MRKKKDPSYNLSGSLSGENPYLWLLDLDSNQEPSDVEHRCFLRKSRPFCPFSLQNWAIFVHPVQSVQILYPIYTQTAPKTGKATLFRSMFHCITNGFGSLCGHYKASCRKSILIACSFMHPGNRFSRSLFRIQSGSSNWNGILYQTREICDPNTTRGSTR